MPTIPFEAQPPRCPASAHAALITVVVASICSLLVASAATATASSLGSGGGLATTVRPLRPTGLVPERGLGAVSKNGHLKQGVYLQRGPRTNVQLDTPYVYQLAIVSNKSYKRATVLLFVTENPARYAKTVNLVAHQPLVIRFPVTFCTTTAMTTEGLGISVVAPPSHKHAAHRVFGTTLPLSPAPNQRPNEALCNPAAQPGGII